MGLDAPPRRLGRLLLAVAAAAGAEGAAGPGLQAPAPGEVAGIIAHGPWPPPASLDPSNRVSGNAEAVRFGRRLFHEPRFSANGYVACVTCHQTDRGYTDGISRARGLAPLAFNTPSVLNTAVNPRFGWSGSSDALWAASLRPLLDPREMASSAAQVAHVVRIGDGLACEYRRAFGRSPASLDDETLLVDVAKALAAFQETLLTGRTAFDGLRDALAQAPGGDLGAALAASAYPLPAWRGAVSFVGRLGCAACHAGANFSDASMRVVATPAAGRAAAGGSDAAGAATARRYSAHGPFSDAADAGEVDAASAAVSASGPGRIRVPGLRNVAVTPPYLHDGSADTLRDAVRHAARAGLDERDVDDLVAFLQTLTDAEGAGRAVQRPGDSTCR